MPGRTAALDGCTSRLVAEMSRTSSYMSSNGEPRAVPIGNGEGRASTVCVWSTWTTIGFWRALRSLSTSLLYEERRPVVDCAVDGREEPAVDGRPSFLGNGERAL